MNGLNLPGHNYIRSDAIYLLVRRGTGWISITPSQQAQNPDIHRPLSEVTRVGFHRKTDFYG